MYRYDFLSQGVKWELGGDHRMVENQLVSLLQLANDNSY